MNRTLLVALVGACTAGIACQERMTMGPNRDQSPLRRFPVEVDVKAVSHLSEAEQIEEEEKEIQAVLRLLPAGRRELMGKLLRRPGMPVEAEDQEVARHMSRIASLRTARLERALAQAKSEKAARDAIPKARVRIALISALPKSDADGIVIRQPGDDGIPVVLLNESSATPVDLDIALRTAVRSAQSDGREVGQRRTITIRSVERDLPKEHADYLRRVLDLIRTHPVKELPGIGKVKFTDMLVPHPSSP